MGNIAHFSTPKKSKSIIQEPQENQAYEYNIYSEMAIFCEDNNYVAKREIINIAIRALGPQWLEALKKTIEKYNMKPAQKSKIVKPNKNYTPDFLIYEAIESVICKTLNSDQEIEEEELKKIIILFGFCFPFIFSANLFNVLGNLSKETALTILNKRINKKAYKIIQKAFGDYEKIKGFPLKIGDFLDDKNIQKIFEKFIQGLWDNYKYDNIIIADKIRLSENSRFLANIEESASEMLADFASIMLSLDTPEVNFEDYIDSFAKTILEIFTAASSINVPEKSCAIKEVIKLRQDFGAPKNINAIETKLKRLAKSQETLYKPIKISSIISGDEIDENIIEDYDIKRYTDKYDVLSKILQKLGIREDAKAINKIISWALDHEQVYLLPLFTKKINTNVNQETKEKEKIENFHLVALILCGINPAYITKSGKYIVKKLIVLNFYPCVKSRKQEHISEIFSFAAAVQSNSEHDMKVLHGASNTAKDHKQAGIISLDKYVIFETITKDEIEIEAIEKEE